LISRQPISSGATTSAGRQEIAWDRSVVGWKVVVAMGEAWGLVQLWDKLKPVSSAFSGIQLSPTKPTSKAY